MYGTDTIAAAPLYTEADMAMFSLGSAAELTTHGWTFFRLIPSDDIQGKVVGEFPIRALGLTRYAIIDDGSSYGTGLAEAAAAAATAVGGEVVVREGIDINAEDFSPTIAKILGADAQAVFLGGSYAQETAFNRQLRDKGYSGVFFAPDGSLSPDYVTQAGAASEGTYFTSQGAPTPTFGGPETGPLADFVNSYKARFGEEPNVYGAEFYDGANMIIEALKAGNRDRASVLAYARGIQYQGLTRNFVFSPEGEPQGEAINIYQIQQGKIKWLGTADKLMP
jgi:branched-chain amino acid transport system substrate-binding protein